MPFPVSPQAALAGGVASSAGMVTSAALIMVAVFSAFAALSLIDRKILAVGMADCATRAAQPRTPCTPMAVAIARRTCLALGSSERCSGDANSAPARAALMLKSQGADGIVGLLEKLVR